MSAVKDQKQSRDCAQILFVDDEPGMIELVRDSFGGELDMQVHVACSAGEARNLIRDRKVDLLVTDLLLPDGNGMSLVRDLQRLQPQAGAMIVSGVNSADGAVSAFRGGAMDYVAKPFSRTELVERIRAAMRRQRTIVHRDLRLRKLKDAVRRLNAARKTVSKKVDLLCNDLVGAYTQVSRQMDGVRLQESYKQFISGCQTLEQLLCHSMDWLLRQVGYCNIGIWLTTADQELQLGAYMKYTVAAENDFIEDLQKNLLKLAVRRGFLRLREPETKAHLGPVEARHLASQDVIATTSTYLGETLGVLLLFRDRQAPFSDDDLAALRVFSPLFALALARAVRGANVGGRDEETDLLGEGGGLDEGDGKKSGREDPSEWWKRGESPPF
ncbi:MAG: response regulator [Tepidisphaeraceae bacterium]